MNGLIVILIDGLGGNFFAANRQLLPNLDALASAGCYVRRLQAETCATSMPGRASTITGVPAALHGIYGNVIWDGKRFRSANPSDVRVDSLAKRAKESGLDVACLGFGMIRPEDCDLFHAPFWAYENIESSPAPDALDVWQELIDCNIGHDRLFDNEKVNPLPQRGVNNKLNWGQQCDAKFAEWADLLAGLSDSPDLVFIELASPDYFFHKFGTESEYALHACIEADAQIGDLVSGLNKSASPRRFNIAVVSDHGFSEIKKSIHPDIALHGETYSCEGGILHLHYESAAHLDSVTKRLARHGAKMLDNQYLPADQRAEVAAFLAPPDTDFTLDFLKSGKYSGPSKYSANHGFAAGHSNDERVAIFSGPDVARVTLDWRPSNCIAPTLAKLLQLPTTVYPTLSAM